MSKIDAVLNNEPFINAHMDDLIQEGLASIGIQVEDTFAIHDVYCGKDGILDEQVEKAINGIRGMWFDIVTTTHTKIDIPYMTKLHYKLDDVVPAYGMLRAEPIEINGKIVRRPDYDEMANDLELIRNLEPAEARAIAYFVYIVYNRPFKKGSMLIAQLLASKVLNDEGLGYMSMSVNDEEFKRIVHNYMVTGQSMELCEYVYKKCIRWLNWEDGMELA